MKDQRADDEVTGPQPASRWRDIAAQVLLLESDAIRGLLPQLDSSFDQAVERIRACTGRVVCSGMGKSGHVMNKIAATLASTGTPAFFLHPAEAIHGDLGMIVPGDLLLAASFSGTTEELVRMVPLLRQRAIPVVAITGNPGSPLAKAADLHLAAAIDKEACPLNLAPTASTTATLALGDALAMALLDARGFTSEDFATLHPGGQLGRSLRRLDAVMHSGKELPRVDLNAPLRAAIYEMSRTSFGITAVVDAEKLVGVFSDGDLRRFLERRDLDPASLLDLPASAWMHKSPRTIKPSARVIEALSLMEEHRITTLFVCADDDRLLGLVHVHDLWGVRTRDHS